ncbi:hypothetical protein NQ315_001017 [Exocentrus adspersus]|uniref:Uncharacterized protein n=1 Tax=Exocentrus adspersus TaxID=1586481 RepID=A0AAV8WF62_9CUCU|nr:hypothetical protein NQ315_001017 [Exocentrus adspersus]
MYAFRKKSEQVYKPKQQLVNLSLLVIYDKQLPNMFKYLVFFALLAVAFAVATANPEPAARPNPQIFTTYGAAPLAYNAYPYAGYYGAVVV